MVMHGDDDDDDDVESSRLRRFGTAVCYVP